MDNYLHIIKKDDLHKLTESNQKLTTQSLESGKLIYLPDYAFTLAHHEQDLLTNSILDPKSKNISYDYPRQRLNGLSKNNKSSALPGLIQPFMHRFADFSHDLIKALLPHYTSSIHWGRTSYRPAEIKGRASSKRRDDTRVHVDSFAATPVNGLRILRVFCNINPHGKPRVWHIGESFKDVIKRFSNTIPAFNPFHARLLQWFKITKSLRTAYDHHMLHLHDNMKLDDHYQQTVIKNRIDLAAQSTWVVFTDHVSHAALSGQFLLEQTFYLPVDAMLDAEQSPLREWEREKAIRLL